MSEIELANGARSVQEWAEHFVAKHGKNNRRDMFHLYLELKIRKGLVSPFTLSEAMTAYGIVSGE